MLIRRLTPADVPEVLLIEREAFRTPWSEETFREELKEGGRAHYLAAVENECMVGYAGFWQVLDEGHIMKVATRAGYRRQGIGEQLLTALLQMGEPLGILYWTLEVRESNAAAIGLYEKIGFVSAGLRPGYYEQPKEAANIMWLKRESQK